MGCWAVSVCMQWMLDSFRDLDARIFSKDGKQVDWVFLEVHAEGEWDGGVARCLGLSPKRAT